MTNKKTIGEEIQIVIFRLGSEEFGARIDQVKEIIKMTHITSMPKAPSFIKGVINLRGDVIAVIDLAGQFNLPPCKLDDEPRIIVAEVEDNILGMLVDEVVEVLRISTENINPTPSMIETNIDTRYIEGIGKLENRLFILLNLKKVLSAEEVESMEKAIES